MLVFSAVAFVLIATVLAMILPALLRPKVSQQVNTQSERRDVFRGQFEDIAQDKTTGVLSDAQYLVAKAELERRMLDEIGTVNPVEKKATKPDLIVACIIAVLIPLGAFWVYSTIGQPAVLFNPQILAAAPSQPTPAQIDALLAEVKAKLAKNPNDAEGWRVLAKVNARLERFDEAIPAFEKANQLTPNDPQLLADYAEVQAIANGYQLVGKPESLLQQALKINPNHEHSLRLAGAAAFERKDYAQVVVLWEHLLTVLPKDSAVLPELTAAIQKAKAMAAEKPASSAPVSVTGTVRIAPALASQLSPNATLFVYARAAQGSPMPIAIVRTTAKALPFAFTLDDTTAPMPNHTLSQTEAVVLVARVSKTGDAKAQAGDLQGVTSAFKPSSTPVDIEINALVK